MRKIIHIDMDAFYASVEQRDGPSVTTSKLGLHDEPIAVQGRRAQQAAWFMLSELPLDIFFRRGLQHQLLREPVRQNEVEGEPDRDVDLILVPGNGLDPTAPALVFRRRYYSALALQMRKLYRTLPKA